MGLLQLVGRVVSNHEMQKTAKVCVTRLVMHPVTKKVRHHARWHVVFILLLEMRSHKEYLHCAAAMTSPEQIDIQSITIQFTLLLFSRLALTANQRGYFIVLTLIFADI